MLTTTGIEQVGTALDQLRNQLDAAILSAQTDPRAQADVDRLRSEISALELRAQEHEAAERARGRQAEEQADRDRLAARDAAAQLVRDIGSEAEAIGREIDEAIAHLARRWAELRACEVRMRRAALPFVGARGRDDVHDVWLLGIEQMADALTSAGLTGQPHPGGGSAPVHAHVAKRVQSTVPHLLRLIGADA